MEHDVFISRSRGARVAGSTNFVRAIAIASIGHGTFMGLNEVPLTFRQLFDDYRTSLDDQGESERFSCRPG